LRPVWLRTRRCITGNQNQGRFRYTGQIFIPELGMYHYKARAYSPQPGRFMQIHGAGLPHVAEHSNE